MSEEITTDTLVAGENVQPVTTDTDAEAVAEAKSETNVSAKAPTVEHKDGKLFVDGVRVYTRDDTNKIAARAKDEAVSGVLGELEVESLDQVKSVVSQLRNAGDEPNTLNVSSLKDAVKKKEQTVEELRAELKTVKTEYALRDHVSSLKDNMPSGWNTDQKQAVIDLMKVRNMLHMEGDTFAIKNGEDFLTTDGETPDYATAVEVVGKGLGLPFAKKGIDNLDVDKQPGKQASVKPIDESRLKTDPEYRNAYVRLRDRNRNQPRSSITDRMITDQMKNAPGLNLESKFLR